MNIFTIKKIITTTLIIWSIIFSVEWYNQCFFNGLSLEHNQVAPWYKYNNIAYWESYTCNTPWFWYDLFQCNNGTMSLWLLSWSLPWLYTNNVCNNQQAQWCMLWRIFWQQIYIPHFWWGVPTIWDLNTYLFTWYKSNFVENISICSDTDNNAIVEGNNTYVYCKNWVLKDLIQYNIFSSEQNFNQNDYPYTQCNQLRSSDCQINNTIIKNWESKIFFQSDNSVSETCISETRTCTNWILSWSYYHTNCNNYDGACGSSNLKTFATVPLFNLCSAGNSSLLVPLFNTSTNQRTWTCNWVQWNNEVCIAYKKTEYQWVGQCKVYSSWVVVLPLESQFLCNLGDAININETNFWRTWICTTDYGNSPQCSTKKSLIATGNIIYSYNRDNSVTASLINISPYWAYINNNNNSNSKRFTQNGSFIFQLKFNDSITDIVAKVDNINNRIIKIKDLILDYKNNICNAQSNIRIKESIQYNLLDVQTMVNHCMLQLKRTTNGWYSINMKKNITRGEFIKSAYNFIKTIRPYNSISYNISSSSYKWVPTTSLDQEAIKWLITIKWDKYITHTTSKNISTYRRNSYITSKEIYNLITYILNSHDDNDIYFKAVWEKETITNMMKREQYANIIRRILEQYDRVALGNNIISLENLENRVSWLSTTNQQIELQEIYNTLHTKDPTSFEKAWLSKRSLLNDINNIISNWLTNKKTVISTSLQDVINRNKDSLLLNTLTKKERSIQLFKKMSY